MKVIIYLIVATAILISCKNKGTEKEPEITVPNASELVTYTFKVDGLQDTVVSKDISLMMIKIQSIDQIFISLNDSTVAVSVSPDVEAKTIEEEIINRGGKIIK